MRRPRSTPAKPVSGQLNSGLDPVQGVSGLFSPRLPQAQAPRNIPPRTCMFACLQKRGVLKVSDKIERDDDSRRRVVFSTALSRQLYCFFVHPRACCCVLCWLRRPSTFPAASHPKFHPWTVHVALAHTALASNSVNHPPSARSPSLHPSIPPLLSAVHAPLPCHLHLHLTVTPASTDPHPGHHHHHKSTTEVAPMGHATPRRSDESGYTKPKHGRRHGLFVWRRAAAEVI